jgi:N-methylhydantoinase A/oxoprolinase/acetone carboxylase beta subunit
MAARRAAAGRVRIEGPAIIEEKTSTTVLYPAQCAAIDSYLNIEIEVQSQEACYAASGDAPTREHRP